MKKSINELLYTTCGETVKNNLMQLGDIKFVNKLGDILVERGISQKEFAKMTGLREATISEFTNSRRLNINISHLTIIMASLNIYDIKEIIDIEFNMNTK